MRRMIFLFLFLLAGAAVAQVMVQPGAIQRAKPQVAVPTGPQAVGVDPASTPETARAEIDRLRARIRELKAQLSQTLTGLQSARTEIDEMRSAGGSLVTAQCVTQWTSRNTAGASEDCTASGYSCAAVSGLCHRSCTSTSMCAPGFACDIGIGKCVYASVPADSE